MKKNRVSAGLEASKDQKKALDEVSKKIAEMEGKIGGDLQKMMGQLSNLTQRT